MKKFVSMFFGLFLLYYTISPTINEIIQPVYYSISKNEIVEIKKNTKQIAKPKKETVKKQVKNAGRKK